MDLLTANYTFVNERLARHYGIPNVYGSNFRRVTFGRDEHARRPARAGQPADWSPRIPNRTSPVLRGKWVLDNMLGTPPPQPPPDVAEPEGCGRERQAGIGARAARGASEEPVLRGVSRADGSAGVRARELRRDRQVAHEERGRDADRCVGRASWRHPVRRTGGAAGAPARAVESSSSGPSSRSCLRTPSAAGSSTTTCPTVRQIRREAAASDYRWSSIISGIVKSTPFQMRKSRTDSPPRPRARRVTDDGHHVSAASTRGLHS